MSHLMYHFHVPHSSACRGKALWRRVPSGGPPKCSSRPQPFFRNRRPRHVRDRRWWRFPRRSCPSPSTAVRASRAARAASGRTRARWSISRGWRRAEGSSASLASSAKIRARPAVNFPRSCCIFAVDPDRGTLSVAPSILRTSRVNQIMLFVGRKLLDARPTSFYANIPLGRVSERNSKIIHHIRYELINRIVWQMWNSRLYR